MFRLARILGKTVFELEHTMSITEVREWAEYLSKEPTNSTEIQLALLTTVVANIMGGKAKLEDFLITNYKPQQDNEQVFADEDAIAQAFSMLASQA